MSDETCLEILTERVAEEMERGIAAVGHALRDVIPPRAQRHLLAAQRELFLAVTATIEHRAGRRKPAPRKRSASGTTASKTAKTAKPASRRPRRVTLS